MNWVKLGEAYLELSFIVGYFLCENSHIPRLAISPPISAAEANKRFQKCATSDFFLFVEVTCVRVSPPTLSVSK